MWHHLFANLAFTRRFRPYIAKRKFFLNTSPNFSSRFHGSTCSWQSANILGENQKCAQRLSPVDDDCHIKYIIIHRYASRLLSLSLNCSNATHPFTAALRGHMKKKYLSRSHDLRSRSHDIRSRSHDIRSRAHDIRYHAHDIIISFPRLNISFPRHNYLVPTT